MVYKKTKKALEKQQSRKRRILSAAWELLETNMSGASVKSIAKKAGIATGTFYLYFKDKDALIETMLKGIYQELLDQIKKERAPYTDGFDKLEATMRDATGPNGTPSRETIGAQSHLLRSIRMIVIADMLRRVRLPAPASKEPQ